MHKSHLFYPGVVLRAWILHCSTSPMPPAAMANSKEKLKVALMRLGQVGKNK
jgi:hypothetical protein